MYRKNTTRDKKFKLIKYGGRKSSSLWVGEFGEV